MLRIADNIWIKPDHMSDIIISDGKLNLTSTSGVTYTVKDGYYENVCTVFSLKLGEIKVAVQESKNYQGT